MLPPSQPSTIAVCYFQLSRQSFPFALFAIMTAADMQLIGSQ